MDYIDSLIEKYESIKVIIVSYRDDICISNPSWNVENELRIRVLNQLYSLLISYNISLLFIKSNYARPDQLVRSLSLDGVVDARGINFDLHTFYRNGYIYNLSAVVEGFSRTVANSLELESKKDYYVILTNIFNHLQLEKGNEWQAMMILANVRNGMHNNGVHRSNSKDKLRQNLLIYYNNQQVNFVNGFPIGGITDDLLTSITSDITSYFKMIIGAKEVADIKHIRDMSVIF